MEASQGDELVFVAHCAELALEFGNRCVVQIFLPVERWRAVVREQLAGEFGVDRIGKCFGEGQIRRAGFAPNQISILSVSQATADSLIQAILHAVEAFNSALAGDEWLPKRISS
jgi:hypothetical protein